MPIYVALLRGINVGGHNKIAMTDLRELLANLGFTRVRSLLQSGNVVFDGPRKSPASLEKALESETASRLNTVVDFVVRTADELARAMAANPFPDQATNDPSRFAVFFLKSAPTNSAVEKLQASIKGPEIVGVDGRHLYAIYPEGMGKSKLTNTVIERALGTRGTARNWNTVRRIAELIGV